MITYDILIFISIVVLIMGVVIGLLFSTYIFEEIIEKNKQKKLITIELARGEKIYKCPNCKGLLSRAYDYCHKCGQALIKESEVQGE